MNAKLTLSLAALFVLTAGSAFAQERPYGWGDREWGPRSGITLGLDAIDYHPGDSPNGFGGIGVSIRHQMDPRVAFEANIAAVNAQNASVANPYSVNVYPMQAVVRGYLNPRQPVQLYGLMGLGMEVSSVNDTSTGDSATFDRFGAGVGVGAQLNMGRLSMQADYRWLGYTAPSQPNSDLPAPFVDPSARMARIGLAYHF